MPSYLSPGVYVEEVPAAVRPIAGVGTSAAGFIGILPDTVPVPEPNPAYDPTLPTNLSADPPSNPPFVTTTFTLVSAGEVRLCTTFSDFTRAFGSFSTDVGQRNLAHAVYGFFN